jgi:hypothetical protein
LVVFSSALPRPPSAAEPLRLSGSARRPDRAPAGPGTGPGPSGGRAGLLPILRHREVRAGSGQARAQAGPRAQSRRALRGFRRLAGEAAAGLPEFGTPGSARPPALFSPAWVTLLPCLPGVGVSVALTISRGPLGADRGEECAASTPSRDSRGALWASCSAA